MGESFRLGRHTRLLDNALQDVGLGNIKRLMVTMPPQHGKSTETSHYFPAWFLGENPHKHVILLSYNDEFAAEWGGKVRDVLTEVGPEVFGVSVSQSSSATSRWTIKGAGRGPRGGMKTAGMTKGSVTGRTAHVMIIDDPFAGPDDAESDAEREKRWNRYTSIARTRLRPDGAIILIQTRWHEDDIAGRILRRIREGKTEEEWTVLDFPAIAEGLLPGETDEIGRVNGDPLWPEVYDLAWLENQRREMISEGMGLYYWSALYQQKPIPLGGGMFRKAWERRYTVEEEGGLEVLRLVSGMGEGRPKRVAVLSCAKIVTVDLAAADTEGSAFTVVATWLVTPDGDLVLWDLIRIRAEGPEQTRLIETVYKIQRPDYVGIESVGYQLTEVQRIAAKGIPVKELKPGGRSKAGRALTAAAFQEGGRLHFPLYGGESYMPDYERELYGFPKFKTKDMVDVTSYAAMEAAKMPIGDPPEEALESLAHKSYWRS